MTKETDMPLLLLDTKGRKYIIPIKGNVQEVRGLGVVDTGRLLGMRPGEHVDIAGKDFLLLRASVHDILACIKRGPQWIMPKDSAHMVSNCDIGPGKRVLEIGTGTGALTIVLAFQVGKEGQVITYERDRENARLAAKNLELAGLDGLVELRNEDASECSDVEGFDAVVMDVPRPWELLDMATTALKVSGHICAYLPTMNQVERFIKDIKARGYRDGRAMENLQREIEVGEHGTRPSFDMLGHTGYLCFGRKV